MNRMTEMAEKAEVVVESHWDYRFVGDAMPANLLQLQGLLEFDPDNQSILLRLVKGYSGYAYGWIEENWEQAEEDGNLDTAESIRKRAFSMHRRAWRYGERLLSELNKGYQDVASAKPAQQRDKMQVWLGKKIVKKSEALALLWCATALGGMVRTAENPGLQLDQLGMAKALVLHAVALHREVGQGMGLAFLGAVEASAPPPFGGDKSKSRQYFLDALRISKGEHLAQELQFALTYAVATQDKDLFAKLNRQILEKPLESSRNRLSNVIAKRRAKRALARTSELFE